jgi:hypothetical protein
MNISQITLDIVVNTADDDYHFHGGILRVVWALRKYVTKKDFRLTVTKLGKK